MTLRYSETLRVPFGDRSAPRATHRHTSSSDTDSIRSAVAGISHDINNVLTIVQCYSEFLATGALTPLQQQDLGLARDGILRAISLNRQLLDLSLQRHDTTGVHDLNEVLRDMSVLLGRALGRAIKLDIEPCTTAALVKCAPGQIDRVLLNLILNSRDAMPQGGRVFVKLEHVIVDAGHPWSSDLKQGKYVVLTVEDTGTGIAPEHQSRIFEPAFSTKGRGRGSGIGLSVVKAAVLDLCGDVCVESAPRSGAKFMVRLPAVVATPLPSSVVTAGDGDVVLDSEHHAHAPQASSVHPTVLVVEDDPALRESLMRVLMEVDIDALGASSGSEALQMLATRPIDVIVSEQFVRDMGGTRLLELAFERFPQTLRVLFAADCSPDLIMSAVNRGRVAKVLRKNMHAVTIREEIMSIALEALRSRSGRQA